MGRYRSMWQSYLSHVNAIVVVIDMSDTDRVGIVRDEIRMVVDHPYVQERALPILVFANKEDIDPGNGRKISPQIIKRMLGFELLRARGHKVKLFMCSAIAASGVDAGFLWLAEGFIEALN